MLMNCMVLRVRLDEGESWDRWERIVRSSGGKIDKQWMRGPIAFVRFQHDAEVYEVKREIRTRAGHHNFSVRNGASGY